MDQLKTVFEMKDIIERCLVECQEAGYITKDGRIMVNTDAICDHISKTLIGELMEFEVLRKLAPMFRQLRSIEKDMGYLDDKAATASSYHSLRIGQK